MSVVGINETLISNLTVAASGSPRDYASKAVMVAAGYNLTWYDEDGVALVSQPTWDLVRSDTNGDHFFKAEVVLGAYSVKMTVPFMDFASVTLWTGRGTSYGLDDIGGAIAAASTVTVTPTSTETTATIYDGDSIDISVSITESALTSIGAASLAACDTIRAYIKLNSADSSAAPTVPYTDLTTTITTDTVGTRVVRIVKNAFPSALGVVNANKSLSCTLHLELGEGSKLVTAATVSITILWAARDGAL